jgi:hypothetical protein
MTRDMRMRLWGGDGWYCQESAEVPGLLKLSELPAFAEEHGIPQDAQFGAKVVYDEDGPVVVLEWLVREGEDDRPVPPGPGHPKGT